MKNFIIWLSNSPELHPVILRFLLFVLACLYITNSAFAADVLIVQVLWYVVTTGITTILVWFVIGLIEIYKEETTWKNP